MISTKIIDGKRKVRYHDNFNNNLWLELNSLNRQVFDLEVKFVKLQRRRGTTLWREVWAWADDCDRAGGRSVHAPLLCDV